MIKEKSGASIVWGGVWLPSMRKGKTAPAYVQGHEHIWSAKSERSLSGAEREEVVNL